MMNNKFDIGDTVYLVKRKRSGELRVEKSKVRAIYCDSKGIEYQLDFCAVSRGIRYYPEDVLTKDIEGLKIMMKEGKKSSLQEMSYRIDKENKKVLQENNQPK